MLTEIVVAIILEGDGKIIEKGIIRFIPSSGIKIRHFIDRAVASDKRSWRATILADERTNKEIKPMKLQNHYKNFIAEDKHIYLVVAFPEKSRLYGRLLAFRQCFVKDHLK